MKILVYLALTALFAQKTATLSCYQCGVDNQPACKYDADVANLQACPTNENNFCIFANSSINFYITVQRYCSASSDTNCGRVPTPPGLIVQESCLSFSCDRDGCNSSTMKKMSSLIVVMVAMTSLLYNLNI